jgi:hypothetical protein
MRGRSLIVSYYCYQDITFSLIYLVLEVVLSILFCIYCRRYTIAGLVVIIFALVIYRLATNDQKEYSLPCFSFRMVELERYLDNREGIAIGSINE